MQNTCSAKSEYRWSRNKVDIGHQYIDPVIMSITRRLNPSRILDLGCGNGVLTRKMHDSGFDVTGVDPSHSGINQAKKKYPGISFLICGVYDDPVLHGLEGFDLVVCEEVIEHLYNPAELLRFSKKVLKRHGFLIITTPYYGYLRNLVLALFNRWDHHLTPLWVHGHIKLFSRKTLSRLLDANGFEMIEFHGAGNFKYFWRNMVVVARPA